MVIKNKTENADIRSFHVLYEHKNAMVHRIKYFTDNYYKKRRMIMTRYERIEKQAEKIEQKLNRDKVEKKIKEIQEKLHPIFWKLRDACDAYEKYNYIYKLNEPVSVFMCFLLTEEKFEFVIQREGTGEKEWSYIPLLRRDLIGDCILYQHFFTILDWLEQLEDELEEKDTKLLKI